MQSDGTAHTADTQTIMTIVSSWREPRVQGCKGRGEHSGRMTVKDMSWGQGKGAGRRSLSTGLRHQTSSGLLCAPQVSPDPSSPSFFISVQRLFGLLAGTGHASQCTHQRGACTADAQGAPGLKPHGAASVWANESTSFGRRFPISRIRAKNNTCLLWLL